MWVGFQASNVTPMNDWIAIGALALIGLLIPVGMMVVSSLLRPSVPELSKRATYESGEIPTGGTRIRFNIQYYMVALLFVVFDIETVLLFPWAVTYLDALRSPSITLFQALWPLFLFVGVLLVALAWAWRNGAVQWARSLSGTTFPEAERQ
jgi:NADH-quinone oxidoreductase subunit A